ncbi:hypothetical protein ASPWEDRAFT_50364 [Aspergillus wentii DTO 134E9]|uniref:Uncharacterized protein n=1 Tax=Aspergillus wentii DTO 134E9 TaxID=1073089 RepID=A0A1L9RQ56_ASPWE|nr:uncharacterized protein ASPWEDRAFT_50364 [Aspergillus wentii DTO 134E9]KAI9928487.1 hypothetical protein MW887_002532 [Aspergillus wentii]OJJ37022.1 hypothetical protein ASPWEDRAFT_50364 [Aspergillus wentii DTO 134E9]
MALIDPIDLAQTAIVRVAEIALVLGVQYKRQICGRLGAELFLVAESLDRAGLDQEEQLRVRISKLLREVEGICSCSPTKSGVGYPLLQGIAQVYPDPKAQAEIQQGLLNITSNIAYTESFIIHIQKFAKKIDKKPHGAKEEITTKKSAPTEYPRDIKILAHNVLRDHMCCTCNVKSKQNVNGDHLVRLLLQPPPQENEARLAQFDMLFSSAPWWIGSPFSSWQDVHLRIPWARKSKKTARFGDKHEHNGYSPTQLTPVNHGQFCNLIGLQANSRICLTIQDGELKKSGFEGLKQIVEHVPGISLADILSRFHLTAKMKLALAYILAYSVWQYYDSDWMKTRWTSETIQFVKECGSDRTCGKGQFFAWKPYLSVSFGDEDPESGEYSDLDGEIHHYPRIRALGIMLVEIGIGFPLHRSDKDRSSKSLAARINEDLLLALQYSKDKRLWEDCEYPDYLTAVNHCLDPGTFNIAPSIRGQSDKEFMEGLKQRMNILYDKVVFPLEEVLQGTKWMEQLTSIPPLEAPSKKAMSISAENFSADVDDAPVTPTVRKLSKRFLTKSEKDAKRWLSRMRRLNSELGETIPPVITTRIRIAVLDTGCDFNAPFFLHPDNESRLKGWRDFADGSDDFQDGHGHGTHLVSLIMKIAPDAHVYVARVAKNPDDLLGASENVAQAISWASSECKADIISMSFGYVKDQPNISKSIRKALYERDDSILFFAAASNYGANDKEMFPARHESVISIRGTNTNGDFEDFNPPRSHNEETVFGTLGLDVPSSGLSDCMTEVYKSGTSIATAVAAGIAGTLLGYTSSKPKESAYDYINMKMRTRHGMLAMFKALSSATLKERYLYLAPWKLMGKPDDVRWAIFVAALFDI